MKRFYHSLMWYVRYFQLRIAVREMYPVPRGYGIGYYDPTTAIAYCYPVPLNIIVSVTRGWWLKLRWYHYEDLVERAYSSGFEAGKASLRIQVDAIDAQRSAELSQRYNSGFNDGWRRCAEQQHQRLDSILEELPRLIRDVRADEARRTQVLSDNRSDRDSSGEHRTVLQQPAVPPAESERT